LNLKSLLFPLALLLLSLILFRAFQRQVSNIWFELATHPEVRAQLAQAGDDIKALARLDPDHADGYRARFEQIQETRRNLTVLLRSKERLRSRYEEFLLAGIAAIILLATSYAVWQRRITDRRLRSLRAALEEMARGTERVLVGEHGRDLIARIAKMIEETAGVIAVQRKRLTYLKNLTEWQEAARRVAHELRTPLATMRLQVARLGRGGSEGQPPGEAPLTEIRDVLLEEVSRLKQFADGFSSFAGLGKPHPVPVDLEVYLTQFGTLFQNTWPGITLAVDARQGRLQVAMDRGMVRQVLLNLCHNAAAAIGQRSSGEGAEGVGQGTIRVEVEVANTVSILVSDDGPGIPADIRPRLFEPYVSTRLAGEGHGLGLAISRKIMLEHGGDLELVETSATGTSFRLILPMVPASAGQSDAQKQKTEQGS